MFNLFRKNKKITTHTIDPDEVFMDSMNVSGFDSQQFEGIIERSISKSTVRVIGAVCVIIFLGFGIQLIHLQVARGATYLAMSENNRLHHTPIFAERGVIYDRHGTELAWNVTDPEKPFSLREYIPMGGFSHILGYVGYPTKDGAGFFWRDDIIGKVGIEKKMNTVLTGTNGQKIIEVDARQDIISENIILPPLPGNNVTLTIDAGVQGAMYRAIEDLAKAGGFEGGAGAIMDIKTGEIIALTSYPEYNSNIISEGSDVTTIRGYATDPRLVYLNRAVSGLYTPGSTIKPYLALAALNEGLITPNTTIVSTGAVEIPNPYDASRSQSFRDWKEGGHGVTNIYKAIAESVNTFFYGIGGGLPDRPNIALGISRIDSYAEKFGLDTKTNIDIDGELSGTIPGPTWKERVFPTDPVWRLGDTYNSSIGQFGFQVTVLEMVRAVAALANRGTLVQPFIIGLPRSKTEQPQFISGIEDRWYDVVHQGMRQTVTDGTAGILNVPYVQAAIKTGTAQVGPKNAFMNSWSTGFFPYENPRYAFVLLMDKARSTNEAGASYAVRQFFDWMSINTPEYFQVQ